MSKQASRPATNCIRKQKKYIERSVRRRRRSKNWESERLVAEKEKMTMFLRRKRRPHGMVFTRLHVKKSVSRFVWYIDDIVKCILISLPIFDLITSMRVLNRRFNEILRIEPREDPRATLLMTRKDDWHHFPGRDEREPQTWFEALLVHRGIRDLHQVVYFFLHDKTDLALHRMVGKLRRDFVLTNPVFFRALVALLHKVRKGRVTISDIVAAWAHGLYAPAIDMLAAYCAAKGFDRRNMSRSQRRQFRLEYAKYKGALEEHASITCSFQHEFDEHILGEVTGDRDRQRMACRVDGFSWPLKKNPPMFAVEPARRIDDACHLRRGRGSAVDPLVLSTLGGEGSLMVVLFDMLFDRNDLAEPLADWEQNLRETVVADLCEASLTWGVEEVLEIWKYALVVDLWPCCAAFIVLPKYLREDLVKERSYELFMIHGVTMPVWNENGARQKVAKMTAEAFKYLWQRNLLRRANFEHLRFVIGKQLKLKTCIRLELRALVDSYSA